MCASSVFNFFALSARKVTILEPAVEEVSRIALPQKICCFLP
jgi:hypothetical protein